MTEFSFGDHRSILEATVNNGHIEHLSRTVVEHFCVCSKAQWVQQYLVETKSQVGHEDQENKEFLLTNNADVGIYCTFTVRLFMTYYCIDILTLTFIVNCFIYLFILIKSRYLGAYLT